MILSRIKYFIKEHFPLKVIIKGNNNSVIYPKSLIKRKSSVRIYGNNNKVVIKDNCYFHDMKIIIGFPDCPVNDCYVEIGENTSFNGCSVQIGENESSVTIGSGCMFSFGVEMNCTDTHCVFDGNNNLINRGKFIEIGSNVWICKNAVILKNTKVPDNSIVSQNSIVTKEFTESGIVIAGNPARQVKSGIHWKADRPNRYC